jgi:hypothetical protein
LASSLLVLAGCSGPPTVRVGRVVLDLPRAFDGAGGAREAIRAGVEKRLASDRSATYDPKDREATHTLQLRMAEGLVRTDEGPAPRAELLVRLRPLGKLPLFEAAAPIAPGAAQVADAVLAAYDDAWALLVEERKLEVGKDEGLIAALEDPDPRLRDFVTMRLADRKSRDAVPALCARLKSEPRTELVLRAIGALVAIKDPRAVEPIIELGKQREDEFVLQTLYAVGAIGGRTAQAYLYTVASGHPVEAVRRGAQEALEELERSAGGKP